MIKRLKSYTRAFACIRRKESFCIRTPVKYVYIFTYDKNSSKWILNISNLDEKIDKLFATALYTEYNESAERCFCKAPYERIWMFPEI